MRTDGGRRAAVCAVALAAAALYGCGGGGDGGDAAPTVSVPQGARSVAASAGSDANESNFEALGTPLVRALLSSSADELLDVTGSTRERPQSAAGPGAAGPGALPRLLLGSLRRAGAGLGRERAQSVENTGPAACAGGGTMSMTVDDTDGDGKLSGGDSLAISLLQCVVEPGLPAADGGLTLRINAVELDAGDEPTAVDLSAQLTQLSLPGQGTMDGALRLWSRPAGASQERMRLRFESMQVVAASHTLVYDFDADGLVTDDGGSSFDLSGGIGIGGHTYSIVPRAVFTQAGVSPPSAGALELRDAAADAVRLTVRNAASFDLQLLRAGAVAGEALGRAWDAYRLPG